MLEASDEIVEGVQVVDVEPALLLATVAEAHDRTDVEELRFAVDRCAESLDSQHVVVAAGDADVLQLEGTVGSHANLSQILK